MFIKAYCVDVLVDSKPICLFSRRFTIDNYKWNVQSFIAKKMFTEGEIQNRCKSLSCKNLFSNEGQF